MFHDISHSAGEYPDSINIQVALNKLQDCLHKEGDIKFFKPVSEIICATEYPYVIPVKELTGLQRIIRDADLSQAFERDTFEQQVIVGLALEGKTTIELSIERTQKFWNGIKKFNTKQGRELFLINKQRILNELQNLSRIKSY